MKLQIRGYPRVTKQTLTFASASLASNVPDASEGVAVLPLTEGGTTTTVIKVNKGINTLVITTNQAGDRASRKTFRARSNIAGAVFAFLDIDTLVVTTTVALAAIIAVTATIAILVIITIFPILSRGLGRSRRLGGGGSGGRRVAAE